MARDRPPASRQNATREIFMRKSVIEFAVAISLTLASVIVLATGANASSVIIDDEE